MTRKLCYMARMPSTRQSRMHVQLKQAFLIKRSTQVILYASQTCQQGFASSAKVN